MVFASNLANIKNLRLFGNDGKCCESLVKLHFEGCMLILLSFGTLPVPFRNRERITFDHLVSMKKAGEKAILKVLRDGTEQEFSISLRPVSVFTILPVNSYLITHLFRYLQRFVRLKR